LDPVFINTHFAVSVEETFHHYKVWQLLTATFCHASLWHLIVNMWFFWIVARDMEPLYGSRYFFAFYLIAVSFSSAGWLLFAVLSHQPAAMIGASGAVTAVVTLFTLYHPKREILFMFIIPMPMWMLLTIFLVLPVVNILNGGTTNVAVEAHLAGAGFAFLFK